MGMVLFVTAAIIELSFAAFSLITKSDHRKERSMIRIASFSGFVLLAILPVIDWSFRYYAMGFLLLLLALIGVITLMKKSEEDADYKAGRIILKTTGMIVFFLVVALPAILFPPNRSEVDTTGEYQVATSPFTYEDTDRVESYTDTGENRRLNVEFWYPIMQMERIF